MESSTIFEREIPEEVLAEATSVVRAVFAEMTRVAQAMDYAMTDAHAARADVGSARRPELAHATSAT